MTTSTLREMKCRLASVDPTSVSAAEMIYNTKLLTVKADSGLTYAHLPLLSGKRSREDSINQFLPFLNNHPSAASFTFLGQDISSQIHQDQLQLDRFIAHHMENVRLEMEERRRKCSRRMMAVVEESISKKLKAKEEEIEKIGKLNLGLVDRLKSLYVENQIWRDLAQTNEATASVLRNNLEQVLAQVQDDNYYQRQEIEAGLHDDAQSCCGSNYNNEDVKSHIIAESVVVESNHRRHNNGKLCRSCGKEEACVLLLPCRHLCLCSACGSYLHICPVCKSNKSCSLHVNLST